MGGINHTINLQFVLELLNSDVDYYYRVDIDELFFCSNMFNLLVPFLL